MIVSETNIINTHLAELFELLNRKAIRYFLLTDFECELKGSDLDIFVADADKTLFRKILGQLGWYTRKEPAHHVNHHFYLSPNSDIYLDVKYDLSFANGENECFIYNSEISAIEIGENQKGVMRPEGETAILLYAAHLAYRERGKLEDKHKAYMMSYLQCFEKNTEYNSELYASIKDWLDNDFPNRLERLRDIINPFFRFERKQMIRKERLSKKGYGLKVLFLGTDGAGKTTTINEVNKHLNLKTKKLYLGMGEDGWFSPTSKKIYNARLDNKLSRKAFSIFRDYIFLPFEFALRIIPVKRKAKYSVVLIDRFPGSFILKGNILRKMIYRWILPKPDLVFFLYADVAVLIERKPGEMTVEKGNADIEKFSKVADIVSDGNYLSVNTSELTVEQTRNYIISEIYKCPKVFKNLLAHT